MRIPDCPTCGKAVETIGAENPDWGVSMFEQVYTVVPPADMWLVPCMHRITRYSVGNMTGDVLELRL